MSNKNETDPQLIEEVVEEGVAIGRVFLRADGSEIIAIRRGDEYKYFDQSSLPEELRDLKPPTVIPVNDIYQLPRFFEHVLDFVEKKRTLGLLDIASAELNPPISERYKGLNIKPKDKG